MKHLRNSLLLALGGLAALAACAQDSFPSRPVTIVVPYPAGGTSDGQVRMFQEQLGKLLGQPVIVDNRPGASGAIAAQYVARAKADGHTLLYPNNGVVIAPLLNDKAGYDALKDFKPVAITTLVPMVLVTNKNVPARTLAEFIDYARKQPNGIMYASAGTASYGHLASTRLAAMAGLKVEHIPYKGEAATTLAARSGEVQMLLTTPSSPMLGQVKEGNLTLLGVATDKPSPVVPGTPTINQVVPGFTSEVWFGLLAPAGTPDDAVQKINAAMKKIMAEDGIRAKLLPTGALPHASTPAEFGAIMSRESAQWRDIIAKYKIKAD
jgi:tripartite-type tricarboxylate transporter receptor subunit TctC